MMGARDVVATVSVDWFDRQTELSDLSDFMYHHDVLYKFSLRHWAPGPTNDSLPARLPQLPPGTWGVDSRLTPCNMMQQRNNALRTLNEVIEAVVPPSDPRSKSPEYRQRLQKIQEIVEERLGPDDHGHEDTAARMARLYRLATLVYLGRASGYPGARTAAYARAGLRLLADMSQCARLFPLVVIGFEAHTDDERNTVLDLIRRTEQTTVPDLRLACVRQGLLQAMWNQNDLHASERTQPGYLDKLTTIISFCKQLPSFA